MAVKNTIIELVKLKTFHGVHEYLPLRAGVVVDVQQEGSWLHVLQYAVYRMPLGYIQLESPVHPSGKFVFLVARLQPSSNR